MMSKTRFERINGHEPETERRGLSWRASCVCCCDGSPVKLIGSGRTESDALKDLLNGVYNHHGRIVMEKQKWRCSQCQRVLPLQRHHIRARSKGRDDRVSNLRGDCADCHEKETNPQ
jgi:5-methylcytosine-specific restriction endonuclease McrA